ncbi:MAG: Stp1/IreP family PP2C-type Ser/Thr phosphatase [Myxococcales bacterium]|nr:Stp1/IreP family PP2C-type Ser/Thr phosphatase [Myxococcales bacterium]
MSDDLLEPIALAYTDIGRVKEANEDRFLVDKRLRLYVVADGMGGHAAGDVASETAVTEIRRFVHAREQVISRFIEGLDDRDQVSQLIGDAVRSAGRAIYALAQQDPAKRGMGTTVSLLLLTPQRGFIAHVGDSRVYLIRDNEVFQLTEDHSLINEMIKRGKLRPEDAKDAPYKNAVTRAVGVYADVDVDTLDFELAPGDDYLLCSDGLTGHLRDDKEIAEILQGNDFIAVPKTFVELANERGGSDNITSIVVHLAGGQSGHDAALKVNTLRQMPLFQHLSYVELVEVLNLSQMQTVAAEQVIFQEGDVGDALYLVLEGRVRIEKNGVELAILGPGGHFGEMALMDKTTRSADAVAAMDSKILAVGRRPLFLLMRKDKEIAVKLLWCFVQVLNLRLRATSTDLSAARSESSDFHDLLELEDDELDDGQGT